MPTFRYQAMGGAGAAGAGTIDAPDKAAAVRQLVARGQTPRVVEEVRDQMGGLGLARPRGAGVMSRREMASFTQELATAVRAGLPIVPALRTIAKQGRSERQKEMIEGLIDRIEHGSTLADAMEAQGRPFDDMSISLVNAGEVAGRLEDVLDQASLLMEREVKLKGQVIGALVYPAILLVLVLGAVVVLVTMIVPQVLKAAQGQITNMPLPTRIVQGSADFMVSWWPVILLAVAGLIVGWKWLRRNPATALAIDRFALGVPVLGALLRDIAVARFTRTLGTLLSAGLPVLSSLRIVKRTFGNKALEQAMEEVCDGVSRGRTIAEPMEQTGYFPPLLVQIMSLGERTGRLDETLTRSADVFEEKTERTLGLFTQILPVLVILVMAGLVAFIMLAIFLPLLALQDSIG